MPGCPAWVAALGPYLAAAWGGASGLGGVGALGLVVRTPLIFGLSWGMLLMLLLRVAAYFCLRPSSHLLVSAATVFMYAACISGGALKLTGALKHGLVDLKGHLCALGRHIPHWPMHMCCLKFSGSCWGYPVEHADGWITAPTVAQLPHIVERPHLCD